MDKRSRKITGFFLEKKEGLPVSVPYTVGSFLMFANTELEFSGFIMRIRCVFNFFLAQKYYLVTVTTHNLRDIHHQDF
jgi:hypothetical protein